MGGYNGSEQLGKNKAIGNCYISHYWNYTHIGPADYIALSNHRVEFAPGTTEQNVSISTISDSDSEDMEQFQATLTDPSFGANIGAETATVTIQDVVGTL